MPAASTPAPRRLLVVASDASGLWRRHRLLLSKAVAAGQHVVCLTGDPDAMTLTDMAGAGVIPDTMSFERRGFSPLAAYRVRRTIAVKLGTHRAEVVMVTDDAAVAPVVSALEDRGPVDFVYWPAPGHFDLLRRPDVAGAFRRRAPDAAVLATPVDARRFADVMAGSRVHVIPHDSADLTRVSVRPLPPLEPGLQFRCITPAEDATAHAVFQAAARAVALVHPAATFATGSSDEQMAAAHVIVHPGATPGLVPGLVRALALGRPIVTTDVAGAREVVDERVNGWRVATGHVGGLADAMLSAVQRPQLLAALARASRAKAERHFDQHAQLQAGLMLVGAASRSTAAASRVSA
jgi:hypothetical protein